MTGFIAFETAPIFLKTAPEGFLANYWLRVFPMITVTSYHTKACFRAWMQCENLLTDLHSIKKFFSRRLFHVIDECAFICLGTFNALKSGSADLPRLALLCIGICEECAEICEQQPGETFQQCARLCRDCADRLSKFGWLN